MLEPSKKLQSHKVESRKTYNRLMVLASRKMSFRQRHLMKDILKLLPHAISETLWKKRSLYGIDALCDLNSCNFGLLFEPRKYNELYCWFSKCGEGPSAKFHVLNIHTLKELKLAGNCLLSTRPLLLFDKSFKTNVHLKLIKSLLCNIFCTPVEHHSVKPFHDHVFSWFYFDRKIWFRHYQIQPRVESDAENPQRQVLIEIGPRFVLDPIKIFEKSFSGKSLYQCKTHQ